MNILNHFQHLNLTTDQQKTLESISYFLDGDKDVFILQGYAGSGKTTLLKGLVEYLGETEKQYQLMAPTGRAAKVINQKTGFEATTIHKGIYSFDELQEIETTDDENNPSFLYCYKIRNNPDVHNSVLIVDEASMVSDTLSQGEFFRFGSGHLLKDLIVYSRIQHSGANTKIIFIGDPAQLPPVDMNFSPALDKLYFEKKYHLNVETSEMKEVKRQDANNGILKAATKIRQCLTSGFFNDFDLRENDKDIFNPPYSNFLEAYKSTKGQKIIITYKNKTALDLNEEIRRDKFGSDLPVQKGDIVIIGGNNYRLGIMNGEFAVVSHAKADIVERTMPFKLKGGKPISVSLKWRWIELLLPDEKGQSKTVSGYMLENYLYGDNYLKAEEQRALYIDFKTRYPKLKTKTEEFKDAISKDAFFNCILLKYGYAVTCHKAQGGEWDTSFVFWDRGITDNFNFYETEHNRTGKTNPDYYRWAYTAITRASKALNCINPPYFNSFSNFSFLDINVQSAFQELTSQSLTPVEINLQGEALEKLQNFNLQNATVTIQDHFLKIWHVVNKQYIDITAWERKGYEIRYYFKREEEITAIKFWVNGQEQFRSSFQKLPGGTNSDNFFEVVSKLIENPLPVIVNRNTINTVVSKIEFEIELEEKKPFLKSLHEILTSNLSEFGISIDDIQHHNYRERYDLIRGGEKAVIDFEYDSKGFFGRVVPIESKCNSAVLLQEIRQIVNKLQKLSYAI